MGSVHIFHQIWPYFKENLLKFCVFGVGSQNFPLKNFACEVHLRGVPTELLHFLGVEIYKGSVGNERDKGAILVHPPWMFMTPSPRMENIAN